MRDVGANRLICVSARMFPKSIKDQVAKELGPTVLLVRLEALETAQWPFQVVNNSMKVYVSKFEIDDTVKPNPLIKFRPEQNPFRQYIGELISGASLENAIQREGHAELLPATNLVKEGIELAKKTPQTNRLLEGTCQIQMSWQPKGASFCFNGMTAPIQSVEAVYKVTTQTTHFPFEVSSYTQEGHATLAWVARAAGRIDDKDAEIRFALVPASDGGFSMTVPQIFGFKEGGLFFWGYGEGRQ